MDDLYNPNEPLIIYLRTIIRFTVRILAVLMTVVICLGVLDVGRLLYHKLVAPPFLFLTINDILATFGAFMAILIAIEIFVNISIYLREDVIHVKIVMATAMMAIARKVIIVDFTEISYEYGLAIAAIVLAMSIGYWLVVKYTNDHNYDHDIVGVHTWRKRVLPPSADRDKSKSRSKKKQS